MMSEVIDNSHDKYDMAVEILVGEKSMTKNDANRRLSTLKEKTRETLGAYTGLASKQGKDTKFYYEGKKARQLSADASRSNVSSQIVAAYWLVTSLYPNSIAGKVKDKDKEQSAQLTQRVANNLHLQRAQVVTGKVLPHARTTIRTRPH